MSNTINSEFFFERFWHDQLIHDYLNLLRVFKETGRRYFVDLILPDKQESVYSNITNQRITYSPFQVGQTGLQYKLVLNVPIYFVDTTVNIAGYVSSEEGLGFGKDLTFNATMFTDTSIDTVETGSLVHLYPIDYGINDLVRLLRLFDTDISAGISTYETEFVRQDALFEVVSVNRYTLSGKYGFIWQLQLRRTDRHIRLSQSPITDVLVYDTYTNTINQVKEALTLIYVYAIYRLIQKAIELGQSHMANYRNGFILPYDLFTLVDIVLLLKHIESKYNSIAKDISLSFQISDQFLIDSTYAFIHDTMQTRLTGNTSEAYYDLYGKYYIDSLTKTKITNEYFGSDKFISDLLTTIPDDHVIHLYIKAIIDRQDYSQLIQSISTNNVDYRFRAKTDTSITYVKPDYVNQHTYLYAGINDQYVSVYPFDNLFVDTIRQAMVTDYANSLWYKVHKAILTNDYTLLGSTYSTLQQWIGPILKSNNIFELFSGDTDFTKRTNIHLVLPIVYEYLASKTNW